MVLSGLHLLLTLRCTHECDHCFVWSSPRQTGTMTLQMIESILGQAGDLESCEWIYFEGGEPFLLYAVLLAGVTAAARAGFSVGIVSNGYWATDRRDAEECLRPFRGLIQDLSISSDLYHGEEVISRQAMYVAEAAEALGIPFEIISIVSAKAAEAETPACRFPVVTSSLMYRGRAASELASGTSAEPWRQFTECPHEDLLEPGRVHIDPYGNVHLCQGLSIGNVTRTPIKEICQAYEPSTHPIIGPLLEGGPAALGRRYGLTDDDGYADACQLCYEIRRKLRIQFPDILTPDHIYGLPEGDPTT